jgi:hypothetical protein
MSKEPKRNEHFTQGDSAADVPERAINAAQPFLSRQHLSSRINRLLHMDMETLKAEFMDPGQPSIDKMFCSVIIFAVKTGDYKRLNNLIENMVGKLSQNFTITPATPGQSIDVTELSDDQLLKALTKAKRVEKLESTLNLIEVEVVE